MRNFSKFSPLSKRLFAGVLLFSLVSCGGGGGGSESGSDTGIAQMSLKVDPTSIDSGDFMEIAISLNDIIENEFILKIRYPRALTYQTDSAYLEFEEGPVIAIDPKNNQRTTDHEYNVFFLNRERFGARARGTLKLLVKGATALEDGAVEADLDLNDPDVTDSREFNIDNPLFTAVVAVGVEVNDESVSTPVPTPGPES